MEMQDEIRIGAPRVKVFAALNDPEILRQAIPGCEALEAVSPQEFTATVAARIGPLAARFKGSVTLSDVNPPESYTLSGEGKGGPAGFAKVRAAVTLREEGDATLLGYQVKADIGGKLGQLGGSLVDRTAQKLAGEFFQKFDALVGIPAVPADSAPATAPAEGHDSPGPTVPGWWIAAACIALALAGYLLGR